ncbi:MAG: DUF4974 domain-containing protein [Bacteroidia bacterium]|nr:DUF4974 domain-containing protein [Bacteroidia bacterium]
MNSYQEFELVDFAGDDQFIQHVLHPTMESGEFWRNWLLRFPEKQEVWKQAFTLVQDIHQIENEEKEGSYEQEIWERLESELTKEPPAKVLRLGSRWWIAIAAGLAILIGSVVLVKSLEKQSFGGQNGWITLKNDSGIPKRVELGEKSYITLESFSSVKYQKSYGEGEKAVIISGEAFIDVEEDSLSPLIIYARGVITKVFSNKLRIRAFEGEESVEVEVQKGRLSVYAKVDSDSSQEIGEGENLFFQGNNGVLIKRPNTKIEVVENQRIRYNKADLHLEKMLAVQPVILARPHDLSSFSFYNKPVIEVFEALEKAYGIHMEYNPATLEACSITTKLDDEPLFQKLSIICKALNLSYKKQGIKIVIEGEGC